MKTKTKRIWLALTLVIAFAVAAGLLWKQEPPQIITLPNGEKYQFAGVTYSTRPVPPALLSRLVSWLPASLADRTRKRFAASLSQNNPGQKFPTPRLIVWFRQLGTNAPSRSYNPNVMLADQAGVIAGHDGLAGAPTGTAWLYAAFPVVPKRSRELQCHFCGTFTDSSVGKVTFPNPLYGQFPQWQAESVPTIKKVEDLEVRLDRFETGYPPGQGFGISLEPVENPLFRLEPVRGIFSVRHSAFDISLRSSAGTKAWVLRTAELSDATGNVLVDQIGLFTQALRTDWGGGYSKWMTGTLWPEEAAWRLKLEFKRPAGLATGDQVTFRNVPLLKPGATKPITRTVGLGPYEVVLKEIMFRDGHGNDSLKWHLEIRNAPEDLAVEVVSATTDTGVRLSVFQRAEARPERGEYSIERFASLFDVPANVTNVDVTCTIHQTRTVEFLVKPPNSPFKKSLG